MDFAEGSYDVAGPAAPVFDVPDEQSVQDAIERIEPFLKGQGYLPMGGSLQVLNATAEQACLVLDLIFRLASQQQRDDRSREQLRDQADKDRVALAHALKKNEALDENNRKLLAQVKDLEGKLLAAKHKAEEQERELKQKLQSTTARLNGYLHGGRDAGKRTVAGAGASAGAGGPRRVAPAYDRFKDDPAEAAATTQKLEAELAQLKQQNARLKKQLATAREQLGASPRTVEAGGSPVRDGQRGDQQAMDGDRFDMQAVRHSLADASGGTLGSGEVVRLQKLIRELQLNLEQQQRQLEKAAADRSELHRTLSSLRSKCATLEVERKNAEDRFLRAQRATAAMLDPAVAEAQSAELRARLALAEREMHEANSRADLLKERLAAAEIELESNQRHVGVLKRAIRALPKGQQALEQLDQLVAEELQPLRDQLRSLKAELEATREQRSVSPRNEEPSCAGALMTAPPQGGSSASGLVPNRLPSEGLALSPAVTHPSSPTARFDGFKTRPSPSADSPSLIMQPLPVHAYYNRTYSSTMPTERPSCLDDAADPQQESRLQIELPGMGGSTSPGAQTGSVSGASIGGVSGGAFMRRSVSAGVAHRVGEAYVSAERQRARWQVHNPMARQRFPSPIDIILEQARNPTAADSTISIRAAIPEGVGVSSQGSTP